MGVSSKRIYKIISARELSELYAPYHTLDPAQAIERICEAKGIPAAFADETAASADEGHVAEGVELLRRMHSRSTYKYYVIRY